MKPAEDHRPIKSVRPEQAAASLERVAGIWDTLSEEEQDRLDAGIKVRIYLSDLADIDTSSGESPVPLQ